MAVDHLEGFCKYKKLDFNRADQLKGGLMYDAINMQLDESRQKNYQDISGSYFDSYGDRTEYALSQITIIG